MNILRELIWVAICDPISTVFIQASVFEPSYKSYYGERPEWNGRLSKTVHHTVKRTLERTVERAVERAVHSAETIFSSQQNTPRWRCKSVLLCS